MLGTVFLVGGAIVAGGFAAMYRVGKKATESDNAHPNLSFDEFIDDISDMADHYMITEEKKTGVRFAGGDCEISISGASPNSVKVTLVMYSQDATGGWKRDSVNHTRPLSAFTEDGHTQNELKKIRKEPMKFKVTRPKKEEK